MEAIQERTAAFVTLVPEGGIIVLPPDFPVGASILVSVIPSRSMEYAEEARKARFGAALSLLDEAAKRSPVDMPDEELDALIEEARQATGKLYRNTG